MNKAVEMQNWLASARKNERFVYHNGLLAADRLDVADRKVTTTRLEANQAAVLAYQLYKSGSVTLVQRRVGHERSEYLAVKL